MTKHQAGIASFGVSSGFNSIRIFEFSPSRYFPDLSASRWHDAHTSLNFSSHLRHLFRIVRRKNICIPASAGWGNVFSMRGPASLRSSLETHEERAQAANLSSRPERSEYSSESSPPPARQHTLDISCTNTKRIFFPISHWRSRSGSSPRCKSSMSFLSQLLYLCSCIYTQVSRVLFGAKVQARAVKCWYSRAVFPVLLLTGDSPSLFSLCPPLLLHISSSTTFSSQRIPSPRLLNEKSRRVAPRVAEALLPGCQSSSPPLLWRFTSATCNHITYSLWAYLRVRT